MKFLLKSREFFECHLSWIIPRPFIWAYQHYLGRDVLYMTFSVLRVRDEQNQLNICIPCQLGIREGPSLATILPYNAVNFLQTISKYIPPRQCSSAYSGTESASVSAVILSVFRHCISLRDTILLRVYVELLAMMTCFLSFHTQGDSVQIAETCCEHLSLGHELPRGWWSVCRLRMQQCSWCMHAYHACKLAVNCIWHMGQINIPIRPYVAQGTRLGSSRFSHVLIRNVRLC